MVCAQHKSTFRRDIFSTVRSAADHSSGSPQILKSICFQQVGTGHLETVFQQDICQRERTDSGASDEMDTPEFMDIKGHERCFLQPRPDRIFRSR